MKSRIILIFILFFAFLFSSCSINDKDDVVNLGFVGEIMLDEGISNMIGANNGNYKIPLLKVKDELQSYDILLGSLRATSYKNETNYCMNEDLGANAKIFDVLEYGGFDLIFTDNLSNFKCGLSEIGNISHMASDYPSQVVFRELENTSIAIIGYNWREALTNSILYGDDIFLEVEKLDADIIIVSLDWGPEDLSYMTDSQRVFARRIIDSGADIVIGSQRYVAPSIEEYKGGIIAYSLGNFLLDKNLEGVSVKGFVDKGGILNVTIKDKSIYSYEFAETVQNHYFQVRRI